MEPQLSMARLRLRIRRICHWTFGAHSLHGRGFVPSQRDVLNKAHSAFCGEHSGYWVYIYISTTCRCSTILFRIFIILLYLISSSQVCRVGRRLRLRDLLGSRILSSMPAPLTWVEWESKNVFARCVRRRRMSNRTEPSGPTLLRTSGKRTQLTRSWTIERPRHKIARAWGHSTQKYPLQARAPLP